MTGESCNPSAGAAIHNSTWNVYRGEFSFANQARCGSAIPVLTLAEARDLLTEYVGANRSFVTRLNLVAARLIQSGNWRGTKEAVVFGVYPDESNRAFITLPRRFATILSGAYVGEGDEMGCGYPLPIRNGWWGYSSHGPGIQLDSRYSWHRGFEPEEGRYTTFRSWSEPAFLRLKFDTTETALSEFHIRGSLNGQPIYEGTGTARTEGITLVSGGEDVTSSEIFDEPPHAIRKPVTNGIVRLYTWDGLTETLVAIYDPGETNPGWRRYRVPGCEGWHEGHMGNFLAICKRGYVPVASDNDEVVPGNIGALRFGLEALQAEDSQDRTRALGHWQDARELLINEVSDDTGAGAEGAVQMEDSFHMSLIH